MNMTTHNFMGRHVRNLLHLLKGEEFICSSHGCPNIGPYARACLLLSLSPVFHFFKGGMTSSIEMPGETAWLSSRAGVDEPLSIVSFSFSLSVILNLLRPMLERGSFFFPLIFAYISLLNLVAISKPKKSEGLKQGKRRKDDLICRGNLRFLSSRSNAWRT